MVGFGRDARTRELNIFDLTQQALEERTAR